MAQRMTDEERARANAKAAQLQRAAGQDGRRTKPRVGIVMTPEAHAMGVALAAAQGVSLSGLLERLVRAEHDRSQRKARRGGGE